MLRILGLYDASRNEWDKLAYIHGNAEGKICVNGRAMSVALHPAGEEFCDDADYFIVIPACSAPDYAGYMAVNSGELLLRLDEGAGITVVNPGFAEISARVEFWRRMTACVLTISDRVSRGARSDSSGPALAGMAEALGIEVTGTATVPDDMALIAGKIMEWTDGESAPELVLTTGGTGLSRRDVTPEALTGLQERPAPGFGELMRSRSMLHTPRGCLSRSLAVIRGGTLVIAFPGSETAVRQCFAAIAPSLRHGIEILSGHGDD
jgi:molybdenum cofactor synthesis domain-containing protein